MNAWRLCRARRIVAAFASVMCVQFAAGQTASNPPPAGAPPKIINIVYQRLIPGKGSAYAALLEKIAHAYKRENIPVYWITCSSVTGNTRTLTLNLFNSFADLGAAAETLSAAMTAHPDLVPMQENLLSSVSSETNVFAVRRNDIGYRATTIDFSKARILRVATVVVRQGYEAEFEQAMKSLAAAYEKVNANSAWVLYQVNAGAPSTTFVFFMPMRSMQEMDDYIARGKALGEAEGPAIEAHMREAARDAYKSWDSELFFIDPQQSHVPTEFAAGDPEFWTH
jgi:hypothetical protein